MNTNAVVRARIDSETKKQATETVIQRHRRRKRHVRRITLDFDPTHDPTHGGQLTIIAC